MVQFNQNRQLEQAIHPDCVTTQLAIEYAARMQRIRREQMETENWSISLRGTMSCFNARFELHREKGPSRIYEDGRLMWDQHNQRHRTNGPSSVCPDGYVEWFDRHSRHRTDGPAIIYAGGDKEYMVKSRVLSPEEFFLKYGVL